MIRNFVTGIVVGGVVAAVGLGVVSQLAPMPGAQVAANAPAKPAAAPVQLEEAAPVKPAAPVAAADKPAVTPVAPTKPVETAPEPAKPSIAADETRADKPAVVDKPAAPEAAAPDPATAAPQPKAVVEAPPAPAAPQAGTAPEVAAATETAPAKPALAPLPQIEAADAPPASPDLPPPAAPETDEALLDPAPAAEPAPPTAITLDPPPEPAPAAEVPKTLEPDPAETLQPSTGLEKTVDGVKVGRLPSIAAPTEPGADAAEASPPAQDTRPLVRFARSFQNDAGKPLFAVLLLDTGAADLDRAKLAALPFPVSFVIDPLDPAADAAEAIYRAAGQEVVMLAAGIPDGATAADLEQTFQANAAVLDQSVAVMDLGSNGFQDNRPLATQVVPLIKQQGRGLITFDKGLNAADQVARRDGVAAAVIFRDLDAEGEDTPLIRRYLDRAAFKAAQEGRVLVLGTTRPETVAALMEWTLEGRASAVALAPLTAVLVVK